MPIYNYICQECGFTFKIFKSMKEHDSETKCPSCSGVDTKKTPSVSSFSLKGQGWYKDGYK